MIGWLARSITRLGYGQHDVDYAFELELERSREERTFEYGTQASRFERGAQWLAVLGLTLGFAGMWGGGPLSTVGGGLFSIGGLSAIIVLLRAGRRRDFGGRFWLKFWKGRIGGWMLRQAARFGETAALNPSATHRPTELALGMAAEQLYDSLPKDTRRQLRDLPDVVHRLERDAQKMRARLEELQEALADVGQRGRPEPAIAARHNRIVADLTAERDLVEQRLKDAVAALETIRLNLLRLHAGTGTVHSLTTDLGLAREVAEEISGQVDGHREVARELQR
jgi:serine/threonine-protein kinase